MRVECRRLNTNTLELNSCWKKLQMLVYPRDKTQMLPPTHTWIWTFLEWQGGDYTIQVIEDNYQLQFQARIQGTFHYSLTHTHALRLAKCKAG